MYINRGNKIIIRNENIRLYGCGLDVHNAIRVNLFTHRSVITHTYNFDAFIQN